VGHGAHSHKGNGGNWLRGSAPGCQNAFCFSLLAMQRGLSATYPAPFRPFLKQQMWIVFSMHIRVKNVRISVQGVFHVPKKADFDAADSRVFMTELQVKRHNFQGWESFRGASQHLKDVPFECEYCWGCTV